MVIGAYPIGTVPLGGGAAAADPLESAGVKVTIENLSDLPYSARMPIDVVIPWDGAYDPGSATFRAGNRSGSVQYGVQHGYKSRWMHITGLPLRPKERIEGTIEEGLHSGGYAFEPPYEATLPNDDLGFRVGDSLFTIPTNFVMEQESSGRFQEMAYRRMPNDVIFKTWLWRYPSTPMVAFFYSVWFSSRQGKAWFEGNKAPYGPPMGPFEIEVPTSWRIHVDWLKERGGKDPFTRSGKTVVPLHDAIPWMVSGQGVHWQGVWIDWDAANTEQRNDFLARSAQAGRPVKAQADPDEWFAMDNWSPYQARVSLPDAMKRTDGGRAVAQQRHDRFDAEIRRRSKTASKIYDEVPLGLRKSPNGAGAQEGFGVFKCSPLHMVEGGSPKHLHEQKFSLFLDLMRPARHARAKGEPLPESDPVQWGDFPDTANPHPDVDQMGMWAEWPSLVATNRLSMPKIHPPGGAGGVSGMKSSHNSFLDLCIYDIFGGDPQTRDFIKARQSTYLWTKQIDKAWVGQGSQGGPSQIRSFRHEQAACFSWFCIQDNRLIDRMARRIAEAPPTDPRIGHIFNFFWTKHALTKGRFQFVAWAKDGGYDEWFWQIWQTTLTHGLFAAERMAERINHANHGDLLKMGYFQFKTFVDYGFRRSQDTYRNENDNRWEYIDWTVLDGSAATGWIMPESYYQDRWVCYFNGKIEINRPYGLWMICGLRMAIYFLEKYPATLASNDPERQVAIDLRKKADSVLTQLHDWFVNANWKGESSAHWEWVDQVWPTAYIPGKPGAHYIRTGTLADVEIDIPDEMAITGSVTISPGTLEGSDFAIDMVRPVVLQDNILRIKPGVLNSSSDEPIDMPTPTLTVTGEARIETGTMMDADDPVPDMPTPVIAEEIAIRFDPVHVPITDYATIKDIPHIFRVDAESFAPYVPTLAVREFRTQVIQPGTLDEGLAPDVPDLEVRGSGNVTLSPGAITFAPAETDWGVRENVNETISVGVLDTIAVDMPTVTLSGSLTLQVPAESFSPDMPTPAVNRGGESRILVEAEPVAIDMPSVTVTASGNATINVGAVAVSIDVTNWEAIRLGITEKPTVRLKGRWGAPRTDQPITVVGSSDFVGLIQTYIERPDNTSELQDMSNMNECEVELRDSADNVVSSLKWKRADPGTQIRLVTDPDDAQKQSVEFHFPAADTAAIRKNSEGTWEARVEANGYTVPIIRSRGHLRDSITDDD